MRAKQRTRARGVIDELVLPPSAWKRVPGGPDEALEAGLRQWLACGIYAEDRKLEIALPSPELDVLWCGFIMSTARYGRFSRAAFESFMHRRGRPGETAEDGDGRRVQIASTAVVGRAIAGLPERVPPAVALANTRRAWDAVARPRETCAF